MICVTWGTGHHPDCDVVVTSNTASSQRSGSPGQIGPWPAICTCDCHVCKRAWWDKGRPILRNNVIITNKDEVNTNE